MFKPLKLTCILIITSIMIAACGGQSEDSPSTTKRAKLELGLPVTDNLNVIIISFDALRADALGSYGYDRPTSPNIDAFAQESIIFDDFISAAQSTPTSFASAFSGQIPFRVFHNWKVEDTQTISKVFADAGYTTVGFINNLQLDPKRHFDQGWDKFVVYKVAKDSEVLADTQTWIKENRDKKMLLWVHFLVPHSPYVKREGSEHFYKQDYAGKFPETTTGKFTLENQAEVERARNLYDGQVFFADTLFKQLKDTLEENGLMEKSIVFLTADHGEEFMDHGMVQHTSVHREVIRIPGILHHPKNTRGIRSEIPASNVDLLPTFAALANIGFEPVLDGRNLNKPISPDRIRVSQSMTGAHDRQIAVYQGQHKMITICMPGFSEMLYNVEKDPLETTDIILDHPAVATALSDHLALIMGGDPCNQMSAAANGSLPEAGLDEETIEKLKSLGYLQ